MTWLLRSAALGLVLCLLASSVQGTEDYPSRPITLVVPYPAGGGTVDYPPVRELGGFMRSEIVRIGKMVEQAGIARSQ